MWIRSIPGNVSADNSLLFQDEAGRTLFEDIPSGVCGSAEEGKNCLSGWTDPEGKFQIGPAGGCGAYAGRA